MGQGRQTERIGDSLSLRLLQNLPLPYSAPIRYQRQSLGTLPATQLAGFAQPSERAPSACPHCFLPSRAARPNQCVSQRMASQRAAIKKPNPVSISTDTCGHSSPIGRSRQNTLL